MRHLIVMRHAKAERGDGKPDYERTLEARGWSDADLVGQSFVAAGLVPDEILCSAARRTRDTLAALLPHFGRDCSVRLMESLYDADVPDLREAMRRSSGSKVLLIGHNPACHGLATVFAGLDAGAIGPSFPTSTAAVFAMGFAVDTVRLEALIRPAAPPARQAD